MKGKFTFDPQFFNIALASVFFGIWQHSVVAGLFINFALLVLSSIRRDR